MSGSIDSLDSCRCCLLIVSATAAVIYTDRDGLITVTGGKWTTYRRMAEETVDAAVATGRLPLNTGPCRTRDMKLRGGRGYRSTSTAEVLRCGIGLFIQFFGFSSTFLHPLTLLTSAAESNVPGRRLIRLCRRFTGRF